MREGDLRQIYDAAWFTWLNEASTRSARVIVPLLLAMTHARSVLDVGCGVGSFLRVFAEHGCEVDGIDGPHVDPARLEIPPDRFRMHDLDEPVQLSRTYDLVLALEVAEHLPPRSADAFIAMLARAGSVIAFSAAIPKQGGDGHVNERWPDEWAADFARHGLDAYDLMRDVLWEDDRVDWWYRQNMVLYAAGGVAEELGWTGRARTPRRLVHPRLYEHQMRHRDGTEKS